MKEVSIEKYKFGGLVKTALKIGDIVYISSYKGNIVKITAINGSTVHGMIYSVKSKEFDYSATSFDISEVVYKIDDMEQLNILTDRILSGDEMVEKSEEVDATAITVTDKDYLVSLKASMKEQSAMFAAMHSLMEEKIEAMRDKLREKTSLLSDKITTLKENISTLEKIIAAIETFCGIKEEVVQLKEGTPASADNIVYIHQAVIYMDEEMALIDDDFDYTKIESFDKWLTTDNHFKELLSEQKSFVAIKPRRTKKDYGTKDPFTEWIMNRPNFETYFLLRNGENVYKIVSEHIVLQDRLFPNQSEFLELQKTIAKNDYFERSHAKDKLQSLKEQYVMVSLLIEGVVERTEVFAPNNIDYGLFRQGKSEGIEFMYELGDNLLSDGKPLFKDYAKSINAKLKAGDRIILCGHEFLNRDFIRWYARGCQPLFPDNGLYTLENMPKGRNNHSYSDDSEEFIIRYFPNSYWHEYKNRVSISVVVKGYGSEGVLNFEALDLDTVNYYMNSRLHRSQYYDWVKFLNFAKKLLLEEKNRQDAFCGLLMHEIANAGYEFKEGVKPLDVCMKALNKLNRRLKWKRFLDVKEKETFYLVKRTVLSKEYKKLYLRHVK